MSTKCELRSSSGGRRPRARDSRWGYSVVCKHICVEPVAHANTCAHLRDGMAGGRACGTRCVSNRQFDCPNQIYCIRFSRRFRQWGIERWRMCYGRRPCTLSGLAGRELRTYDTHTQRYRHSQERRRTQCAPRAPRRLSQFSIIIHVAHHHHHRDAIVRPCWHDLLIKDDFACSSAIGPAHTHTHTTHWQLLAKRARICVSFGVFFFDCAC